MSEREEEAKRRGTGWPTVAVVQLGEMAALDRENENKEKNQRQQENSRGGRDGRGRVVAVAWL